MPAPITAERLETRNRERLAPAEALLRQLESAGAPFTRDSVITTLNDLQVEIHNLAAECGIYVAMHPDRDVQQLAEKLQREAAEFGQRQPQSRAGYDAARARNIRSDTRHIALEGPHELNGLPEDYVATHQPGPDGVIRISTNPPDH